MTPWLPLYLLLVVAATLSPFQSICGSPRIAATPQLVDALGNLVLFAPLGLALRRKPLALVLAAALGLSASIEAAQLVLPRTVSPFDVAANVSGALLGRAVSRWLPLRPHTPMRLSAVALAAAAIGIGWVASVRPTIGPNDFSNWEIFPLMIGNEAGGTRSWQGTIAELWLYDRELDRGQRPDEERLAPARWAEGGPILWMRFESPPQARLDGPSGPTEIEWRPPIDQPMTVGPEGLHIRGGRWQLPDVVARHVYERLVATHELSVAARVRPEHLELTGPGRILSFSIDTGHRNFMLGQELRNVAWRVRTPWAGLNGNTPEVQTRDEPLTGEFQTHVGSFGGVHARIEVDGECRAEQFYPSALGAYPLAHVMASIAGVTAMAGLGLAGLMTGRRRRVAALSAGAGAAWLILWSLGTWSHVPSLGMIAALLGLAGWAAALPIAWRGLD